MPCNAGDVVSIPGRGTKIPHALEQLSVTTTKEHTPQLDIMKILCAAVKA